MIRSTLKKQKLSQTGAWLPPPKLLKDLSMFYTLERDFVSSNGSFPCHKINNKTTLSQGFIKVHKQFVVTNCSKERPSWVVTETLKNGILITIVASKELNFYCDFKYISFIKFSLIHQKLEPEKVCLILENRGKHPLKLIEPPRKSHHQIHRIREFYWRGLKLLSTKMWNLVFFFFTRRQITDACLFVFFPRVIVSIQ